jgi:hypothetical protein
VDTDALYFTLAGGKKQEPGDSKGQIISSNLPAYQNSTKPVKMPSYSNF